MLFKSNKSNDNNTDKDIKLVLLKSTNDNYELMMIESILKDNLIPYICHEQGSGGYMRIYMGTSFFGTDVMIEEKDFEKASELISEILQKNSIDD